MPPDHQELPGRARQDRTTRFLRRLDAHLRRLADDAGRLAFLSRLEAEWEARYARFVASEGASEPVMDPADPPQALDFLATITALAARRIAIGATTRVAPTNARGDAR